MVGMSVAMNNRERKIVVEFCHLLEKSKQLFNGLRDLPQYGHKQWQSYYGRAFDVYTKLWKFQQYHRIVLDCKYGLKRWQIGEIASKIGQLYYHFYLRTSESAYLNEAYSFYYAIRGRAYYTRASKEDRCDLMVKKLRYYARFMVVCLLLKKMKLLKELITELDRQIIDYGNTYDPQDQVEWTVVVDEIKLFVHADSILTVLHGDSDSITLSHRLTSQTTPPVERSSLMNFSLQEILIIGSCADQVKFSELTIDMFRIMQTLEREPNDDIHQHDGSPRSRGFPYTPDLSYARSYLEDGIRRENPHKYLLYKPSLNQVLVYLASGCKDLPPNGALLLYISADGCFSTVKHPEDYNKPHMSTSKASRDDWMEYRDYNKAGYDLGGVATNSKREPSRENSREGKKLLSFKEVHCLYPGDLEPFTRRPLFIIMESDNSFAFQHIARRFGQPLVILMSPLDLPQPFQDQQHQGSLFTLFLHSPLTAFCYCCDISSIPMNMWEKSQAYVEKFMAEASRCMTRSRIDSTYIQFFGDDYLRLLILRFIFCDVVLHMHRSFDSRNHRPKASPPLLEAEILDNPTLIHIVLELAIYLDVRSFFGDPGASSTVIGPPSTRE